MNATQEPLTDHRRFMGVFWPSAPVIKAFILAAVRDPHDADDLFQEVSSVLWEKFSTYDAQQRFLSWALGVARLEVLNWRRKHANAPKMLSPEALEALSAIADESAHSVLSRHGHLRECLGKLPKNMDQVIRMRYLESMRIHDIAGLLSKSVPALEMMLVRARRLLRKCIERRQIQEVAP